MKSGPHEQVFFRQSVGDKTGTVSSVSLVLDFPSRRWKPTKIKAKYITQFV